MAIWKAQVSLGAATGVAEDAVVNDFIFNDHTDHAIANGGPLVMTQALDHFYNAIGAGSTNPLSYYLSRARSRVANAVTVKYYNVEGHLDGSAVGSPTFSDAFTLGPAHTSLPAPLPAEVAAVLTLRGLGWAGAAVDLPGGPPGPAGDTRPRQRKSGRIFLGTLTFDAADEADATGHRVRINSQFRTDILQAANRLADEMNAGLNPYPWSVWSRKGSTVMPITHVQMDDAFDVVRSRGPAASIRDTVAV